MTYSLCVRESYTDATGENQTRYGVGVTTRRPAVGSVTPHVSEHGAVATQASTNRALGERGIRYIDDGLAAADALEALLNSDAGSAKRQLHGVSGGSTFVHTGAECGTWCGDLEGAGFTVAGNGLAGEPVIEETAETYRRGDRSDPLEVRLVEALEAGYAVGGDDRGDQLTIQSAAVRVCRTEPAETRRTFSDIRVDATERPIEDLRSAYEGARKGHEEFLAYKQ